VTGELKIMSAHRKILNLKTDRTPSTSSELISIWICIVFCPGQIYLNKFQLANCIRLRLLGPKPTKCDYMGHNTKGGGAGRAGRSRTRTCQMSLCFRYCPSWTRDQAAKSLLVCCMCFTLYHSGIRYLLRGLRNTGTDWYCKAWNECLQKDNAGNNWN